MQQTHPTVLSNSSLEDDLKLKILIRNSGKTQAQIADEIGVDRTYMSQLATGKVSWVNSSYFGALTKALGMTDDQIKAVKPSAVIESNAKIVNPTEIIMFASRIPSKDDAFDSFMHYADHIAGQRNHGELTIKQINENSFSVFGYIDGTPYLVTTQYAPDLVQALRVKHTEERQENLKRFKALPHGLQEAVELYGKRYSDLQDSTWQTYLAGFRWREGEPEEPEAWLDLYRDLVRAGVVPGSN